MSWRYFALTMGGFGLTGALLALLILKVFR